MEIAQAAAECGGRRSTTVLILYQSSANKERKRNKAERERERERERKKETELERKKEKLRNGLNWFLNEFIILATKVISTIIMRRAYTNWVRVLAGFWHTEYYISYSKKSYINGKTDRQILSSPPPISKLFRESEAET